MSTSTYTDLFMSPADWDRKKIRAMLENKFGGEWGNDEPVVDDSLGTIHLIASDCYSYDELCALRDAGVSFHAYEDSRCESEGAEYVFVAHKKQFVYMQEDGNGHPVVRVLNDGSIFDADLQQARDYWRLKRLVERSILRKFPAWQKAQNETPNMELANGMH